MPLGRLLKSEVRRIARKNDLRTSEKSESREICFVADNNYRRFLREYAEEHAFEYHPGEIVHTDGRVLGQHDGTEFFTVGQRKGLGVSYPTPLYVRKIDTKTGRVIVGGNDELFTNELTAEQVNWVALEPPTVEVDSIGGNWSSVRSFECEAKIRYLHKPAPAALRPLTDSSVRVIFKERQRAITPGQSVVFYDGDIVLGGGVIE